MGAYSRALLLAATLCIAAVRAVSLAAPHALHALRPALRGGAPVNGDASDSSGSPGREAGLSCSASHPRVAIQLTESDTILRGGGGVSSSSTPPSEALHLSESDHALGREGLSACEATPHRSKPGDEHTAAAPRKRGLLWGLARRTTRAALWLSRSCYPVPPEEDEEGECGREGWRGWSDPSRKTVQATVPHTTTITQEYTEEPRVFRFIENPRTCFICTGPHWRVDCPRRPKAC